MDPDKELTPELLGEFINEHRERLKRYQRLMKMYKGQHDILFQEKKELSKPDNRLVVNFAKYIVDTLNGYFIGNPIKTVHPDKVVSDQMKRIAKRNSQNDNNAELSKMCSIYGHAYEFLWLDNDLNNRVTYMDPQDAFVIYDDTIAQEPLYGVHILTDETGRSFGTIYSRNDEKDFYTNDKQKIVIDENSLVEHFFDDVPLIEYIENEERQSAFENVESLINAYNKALSEKANDVDYFADAYLAILGAVLDEEMLNKIRDNRIINLKAGNTDKLKVEFLDKPNADTTQENLINRLELLIFQNSMVSNINDESFGTSSGIALKFKLQSMENLSLMKERKFNNSMVKRFKMMFAVPTNFVGADKEGYLDIDYIFTRNIPNNLVEEAETAKNLAGITSKKTQLSALSVVDNVQDELDQIEQERSEQALNSFNRDMNTPIIGNDVVEDGQEE